MASCGGTTNRNKTQPIIIIIIITIYLVISLCEWVTPRLPCLRGTDYVLSKVRSEAEETFEHLATLHNQVAALAADEIHAYFGVRTKKRAIRGIVKERIHITAFRNKGSRV